ncbi:MAG: cupin domain-containing protein [Alphaproteobacteria bacterium]|nr:cupin domain-containing protein [Alphaproteobacteria bacterium]
MAKAARPSAPARTVSVTRKRTAAKRSSPATAPARPRRAVAKDVYRGPYTVTSLSVEEAERTCIARYKKLKPLPRGLADAVVPEYERELFTIIGKSIFEDPDLRPPITAIHPFSLGAARIPPGKGTGLHAHDTEEVLIPLNGKLTVMWGPNGENQTVLEAWDVFSVPAGPMRSFRNDTEETVLLLAIVGGHDGGKLKWHQKVAEKARARGVKLDERGVYQRG